MHAVTSTPPRQLTDAATGYWSRIFPTLWSAVAAVVVAAIWLDVLGDGTTPAALRWTAVVLWGGLSAFFFHVFGSFKHVWLVGDELVLGDLHAGTRVDLRDVDSVKESRFQQVKTVTLKLRRPTPEGDTIRFIPRGISTFMVPWMSSPVAAELRERTRELSGKASPRIADR
ncbi:MAG: hypothetical protein PVJ02_12750 [Gemmatimonadota bacterium]